MKFTKKAFASGMAAMALVACGDNESASTAPRQQNNSVQEDPSADEVRRFLTMAPIVLAEVAVDCPMEGCTPDTIATSVGSIRKFYNITQSSIDCHTNGNFSPRYYVYTVVNYSHYAQPAEEYKNADIADSVATKFLEINNEEIIEEFKKDCEIENGVFFINVHGERTCAIPLHSEKDLSMKYTDPNWEKYAKIVINNCVSSPIFEN